MKSVYDWNKYGLIALLLVLNAAFFALMAWVLPIRFEENDDVMMCLIANGLYSGSPDAHLVYINALYGQVLAWLYTWTRAVEWYTLSFAVLHVISMTVIDYTILRTRHNGYVKLIWLTFLYIMWVRIILSFQFTTTAGLVCLAGVLLLQREGWRNLLAGCGLVFVASLIRFHSAALVALLMMPVMVYQWKFNWRKYVPMVVLLALVVGARWANSQYYKAEDWQYYKQYNALRAKLNDNPNARSERVYDNLPNGVVRQDYDLLLRFTPDPEVMNLETLQAISRNVKEMPLSQKVLNVERLDKYAWIIVTLLLLMVLVDMSRPEKKMHFLMAGYALFVLGLLVLVSLDGFVKNRVFLCFVVPVVMAFYRLLPEVIGRKRLITMSGLMTVLCVLYVLQTAAVRNDDYYRRNVIWRAFQQPLVQTLPPDSRLATVGTWFGMQYMNPFQIKQLNTRKFALGWFTYIPFNKEICESFVDLMQDNMYIFVPADFQEATSMLNSVRQQIAFHYGIPSHIELYRRNGAYAIVRLRRTEDWAAMEDIYVPSVIEAEKKRRRNR
ncbi:MAG: hypothetical protein IK073_02410 [Paludibacteraceae bacterium]|nr:hypothetical protein [Paludibacteraceae bacterium]